MDRQERQADSDEAVARGESRVRIGVIYNPRSHRNRGQDLACAEADGVLVAQPRTKPEIAEALADFARKGVTYLIINGGDGTVRDVLSAAEPVFGDAMPELAVLPKGKTNALNVDLGAPADWTLSDAISAFATGRRVVRRPVDVRPTTGGPTLLRGFVFGGGAFALGVRAGQDAHRIGFFNSLAVGVTSVWGVLQALFGRDSNPWRRGVQTDIRLQPGNLALPHSEHGDPARRVVVLATTLQKLPLGIKPFGKERGGLKLMAIDRPRRRLVGLLPLIVAGWHPRWLAKAGYHVADAEGFDITIGDQFILDGEAFPAGSYRATQGPELTFVTA
ncbi:MAG: diacylglycerol kinase family protein [Qipengyuania sp.]